MEQESFKLTQQQIDFFNLFGYLTLPGLFAREAQMIQQKFDALFEKHADEVIEWDALGYSRQVLMFLMDRDPELRELLTGDRIFGVMASLLGDDFNYRNSDGDVFHGNTHWHGDSLGLPIEKISIKMGLYLEPLRADSGAFRVLPGTHLSGDKYAGEIYKQINKHKGGIVGLEFDQVPGVVLETNPGDALLFDFRTKHATCNHQFPRRMICMNFSERYDESELPLLQQEINTAKTLFKLDGLLSPELVENIKADKMRHLQQVIDNGGYTPR